MGERFLIDTNTLIDAQMKRLQPAGLQQLASVIDTDFNISFITYIEFLGYPAATKATEDFIAAASVTEVNRIILDICVTLRKAQRIKLPDAIIAATALAEGYTLVTNNEKDFSKVAGLKILNLTKI